MIERRDLLKLAALAAGASTVGNSRFGLSESQSLPAAPAPVRRVLLVTKCHLDVGFTLTQAKVVRKYFDVYYPAAIRLASDLRERGADRYTWTTGSWLLYEYLEQAGSEDRRKMEQAVTAGDIAWHGLPFSWQTELLDRSMIEGALALSSTLDRRFGRKTTGAKMTDVPGHTRGIVAPLAAGGIRLLDIGVNAASTPPDVPDVFLWKDRADNSIAVMYHRHDYGGILQIPNSDTAVDIEVRDDNSGPHTMAEVQAIYAKLRSQFPGATVQASTMSEVATVVDTVRTLLPVVTGEIGDTWIYGVASDPLKMARYREIARLRQHWLARGEFAVGDQIDRKLLQRLLLEVEHTWGTDTKSYLDNEHYRPADLAAVLEELGYKTMEMSWREKRDDLDSAVATLPSSLREEAISSLAALTVKVPSKAKMLALDPSQTITTKHYLVRFNPSTGAILGLKNRLSGHEWASPDHPLALFTYQTLDSAAYAAFLNRYIKSKADWAPRDFGKPGIAKFGAKAQEWHPKIVGCWIENTRAEDRVLLELHIEAKVAEADGNVAWPESIFLELRMPSSQPRIDLCVVTTGKRENRMPEAMWLTFKPANSVEDGWKIEKAGEPIELSEVVRGGGRSMHAISGEVSMVNAGGDALRIRPLDTPLVAFGERSPLNFSLELPDTTNGIHFCLFNNAWGTNYPQWCGGDWMARFTLNG